MSRSYKKNPILKDGYGHKCLKWYKRQANKKVRRNKEISNGKSYRKIYETWIFRDYKFREPFNYYILNLESNIKHNLEIYEGINEISKWLINECLDQHNMHWRKRFYLK